jgi:hypothetical protein
MFFFYSSRSPALIIFFSSLQSIFFMPWCLFNLFKKSYPSSSFLLLPLRRRRLFLLMPLFRHLTEVLRHYPSRYSTWTNLPCYVEWTASHGSLSSW